MRITCVVGARPNFMKVAPLIREMKRHPGVESRLVHTGQHYDYEMSQTFFDDFDLPAPAAYLGVGSGSHAEQTAKTLVGFEEELSDDRPDLVVVVGDVNSTLACSLAAAKLEVPVAHVEAGLRSFDRTMPEEINRVLTDHVADVLFTTCEDANENLLREGVARDKIRFAGNVMIDSLCYYRERAEAVDSLGALGIQGKAVVMTLHRPPNVDDPTALAGILHAVARIGECATVVFPAHPRTRAQLATANDLPPGLLVVEPMGYIQFLGLLLRAALVLTDSGGLQEETTYLGIPCLTLRENTERPVTVTLGTNTIVGTDPDRIVETALGALDAGRPADIAVPPLWDGHSAERVVAEIRARSA